MHRKKIPLQLSTQHQQQQHMVAHNQHRQLQLIDEAHRQACCYTGWMHPATMWRRGMLVIILVRCILRPCDGGVACCDNAKLCFDSAATLLMLHKCYTMLWQCYTMLRQCYTILWQCYTILRQCYTILATTIASRLL